MNDKDELINAIKRALEPNQQLEEYKKYVPIVNSKFILSRIEENINDINYLKNNKNELNVGLLAAKSLEFGAEDSKIIEYANSLYGVWHSLLSLIGQPFKVNTLSRKLAYAFYKKHKFSHKRIIGHLEGIDFKKSVEWKTLCKTNKPSIAQWRAKTEQGPYYCELDKKPKCLGIYGYQEDDYGKKRIRIRHKYKLLKDIEFLKSYAKDVQDIWSMKITGKPHRVKGGCIQYFNRNDKQSVKLCLSRKAHSLGPLIQIKTFGRGRIRIPR